MAGEIVSVESLSGKPSNVDAGRVSLIMPTLNEEESIGRVLKDIPRGIVDELIVVDSSTDDTPSIAKRYGATVIPEPRRGYGRALQTGVDSAGGDIVVYMDGDYTYDPEEIRKLIIPILAGSCDVVLGYRLKNAMAWRYMSRLNLIGNNLISLIFSILFLKRISDTQSGFRAIRRSFLKGLKCKEWGMPYVTEQLIKLRKKGATIGEVPVTYRPRLNGKSKLKPFKDGLRIIGTIIVNRFSREK